MQMTPVFRHTRQRHLWFSPNFCAPSGEIMRQTPTVLGCKNVLEVVYHRVKFGEAEI